MKAYHLLAQPLFFLLFFIFILHEAHGQKNREIGIRFSGLNDFALLYKYQRKDQVFHRLQFAYATFDFITDDRPNTENRLISGIGTGFGIEKRKQINSDFQFMHGPFASINFTATVNGSNYRLNIIPAFGWLFGVQYRLSEKFYLGLEGIPAFSFPLIVDSEGLSNNYNLKFEANTSNIALTTLYKF